MSKESLYPAPTEMELAIGKKKWEDVHYTSDCARMNPLSSALLCPHEYKALHSHLNQLEEAAREMAEALKRIANRPDLPNPDRDADWKNCMQTSSHEAKEVLAKYQSIMTDNQLRSE